MTCIEYLMQCKKWRNLFLYWYGQKAAEILPILEICSISGVNLIVSFRMGPNSDTPSPLTVEVRGWYFLNTTFSGFVYLVSTYRIISLFQFLGSSVTFSGLSFFRLQIPKKYIPLLSLSMYFPFISWLKIHSECIYNTVVYSQEWQNWKSMGVISWKASFAYHNNRKSTHLSCT